MIKVLPDMKTVVVIPAYNEGPRIGRVVGAVRSQGFHDVIVVDDGSHDGTADEARRGGAVVISHCCNRGVGAATRTGWEAAKMIGADVVVNIDSDGQHDPAEITRVADPVIKGEADLTIGARIKNRRSMPIVKRVFNFTANVVTFFLSGTWLADSQSGFRALSRKALQSMEDIEGSGFEICTEIVVEAAHKALSLKPVPVSAIYEPEHRAKGQNYSTGLETVFKLVVRSLMR